MTVRSKDDFCDLIKRKNFLAVFLKSIDAVANSNKANIELLLTEKGQELESLTILKTTQGCLYLLNVDNDRLDSIHGDKLSDHLSSI